MLIVISIWSKKTTPFIMFHWWMSTCSNGSGVYSDLYSALTFDGRRLWYKSTSGTRVLNKYIKQAFNFIMPHINYTGMQHGWILSDNYTARIAVVLIRIVRILFISHRSTIQGNWEMFTAKHCGNLHSNDQNIVKNL